MKKVGIVCDNYKVNKFKEELILKGFTDFEVIPLPKDCSNIVVNVAVELISEISKICQTVELYFKRSK